jgi:hypothetical protein
MYEFPGENGAFSRLLLKRGDAIKRFYFITVFEKNVSLQGQQEN